MTNQISNVERTRNMIASRKVEIEKMLPSHIKIDTFERVFNNLLMRTQDIANCDPVSVYDSVMRCAQDGLIPDGKEAAIVVYGGKGGKKAQYQPMIDGILKRLRQSGMVESIVAKPVFEGDTFEYWMDEEGERLNYRPDFMADGKRDFKLAFARAKLKSGEIIIEVMNKAEIDRVRAVSRSGSSSYGPWAQWYDRMACKSVLHRIARRLPSSSETTSMIETIERYIEARFNDAKDVTPAGGKRRDYDLEESNDNTIPEGEYNKNEPEEDFDINDFTEEKVTEE